MPLPKNYSYTPFPPGTELRKSQIHGYGVFATELLKKNRVLGVTHVFVDEKLIRTPFGGLINHSDTPNAYLESRQYENHKEYFLVLKKDIEEGEELTLKYGDAVCGKI